MKLPLVALLFLAGCSRQADPAPPADKASAPTAKPTAKPAEVAARAFVHDEKTDLIEFHYAWSAEAAAVPQLVDRFRKDLAKTRAGLITDARQDKVFRDKEGYDFNVHSSDTDYRTAGQSPRLLSLSFDAASYTGGAHGNYGTDGLLWDRQAAREVQLADLFASPANMDRLLTRRWCDDLNAAREVKRGEPVGGDAMFDECPPLDQIAIIPTDEQGNGRFEKLMLVASPYVAGPYAEGSYEIESGVTPELLAALKTEYRASFEIQTQ